MTIRKEILDELIRDYKNPEDLLGENGLLKRLTKALLERAMNAELTHELDYEKSDKSSLKAHGNRRNGTSPKTVNQSTARLSWIFRATACRSLSRLSSRSISGGSTASTMRY